jgi:LysM repeat protein
VEKGETINQIAQKYHVTYDIYKLNPDAQSGLKPNSVLLIGKQSVATTPVASASKRMQLLARILLLPKKLYTESKNI